MNTREHHVAGQPPSWSRPSQAFRHFDGSLADDWRHAQPGLLQPRRRRARGRVQRLRAWLRGLPWKRWARRVGAWALDQVHPDPRERRKIYIYLVVATWVVMCTIGVLAAHGIHP